ncbi:MAG: phage tail family protein [Bacillus sp. (in: Bacteria)]|nr:phage tail family protein [Bacillus sp. (in: firmicutes)]
MELLLINKNNQTLDLLNNRDKFVLSHVEGLHGIDTDIQQITSPYLDGSQIEGVKALPRGIALTFKLMPDIKDSIDFFMNVVKSKQFVTLQETEKGKTITIKGVATIPPYTRMLSMCELKLDIYCGEPYWEDLNQVIQEISMILPLLNFPEGTGQYFTAVNGNNGGRTFGAIDTSATKTFDNDGDAATGMNIKITALSPVTNPCIACESGEQYGWYMYLELTLNANDEIEINTVRGNKYIKINGSTIWSYNGHPILSYLRFNGTDWLQLETGENIFKVGSFTNGGVVATNDLYFTITYRRKYE